jgi:hypothetical protein
MKRSTLYLLKKSQLKLRYTEFSRSLTMDNQSIITFKLKRPIPVVKGSQTVWINEQLVHLEAKNVKEIKCVVSDSIDVDFAKKVFRTYHHLDVSKSGQVWVTAELFAHRAAKLRAQFRQNRADSILSTLKPKN